MTATSIPRIANRRFTWAQCITAISNLQSFGGPFGHLVDAQLLPWPAEFLTVPDVLAA
jgi:hypothetical protein